MYSPRDQCPELSVRLLATHSGREFRLHLAPTVAFVSAQPPRLARARGVSSLVLPSADADVVAFREQAPQCPMARVSFVIDAAFL